MREVLNEERTSNTKGTTDSRHFRGVTTGKVAPRSIGFVEYIPRISIACKEQNSQLPNMGYPEDFEC